MDKEEDFLKKWAPTVSVPYDVRIDGLTASDWNSVLGELKDASVYQTWAYGSVSWGASSLSHVVLRSSAGKIAAASQARIVHIPILGGGIAYLPWGPMWRGQGGEDLESFRAILRTLKTEYVTKRNLLLRVRPKEVAEEDGENLHAILTEEGFKRNENVLPYRTFLLDLSPEMPTLMKNMEGKWRNQLRQAMKNPLIVTEGTSDEMFETFMVLSSQMVQRKKFTPGVEYESFRNIQNILPPERKMRIFNCEVSGKPVAVAICSAHGDTGIYLLGATGNQGSELRGANLLQWKIIEWLKKNGFRWYDLGGINPAVNPGVHRFKAGLAGKDVCHLGQYDYWENAWNHLAVRMYERSRKAFRYMKENGKRLDR
jgi:lipid II:glycine glycyltransferase (peptidoglycan interpeptide bridge formation enzyme)